MGLTVLEIDVGNPATPEITEKVEFLIDSGANYSVVPSVVLERLDIRPLAQQEFRLTDGSRIIMKGERLSTSTTNGPVAQMPSLAKKEIVNCSAHSPSHLLAYSWTHFAAN